MAKTNRPTISAKRAASIFRDVLQTRRICCDDTDTINMADLWQGLADDFEETRIKLFKSNTSGASKRAGVVTFGEKTTLIVSEDTMERCRAGDWLCNFFLAHEFMHVELGHFEESAQVRNFQMGEVNGQKAVLPSDEIEYDADFAGVALLCGVALIAPNPDATAISKRYGCPIDRVKAVLKITQLSAFKQAFSSLNHTIVKVIL